MYTPAEPQPQLITAAEIQPHTIITRTDGDDADLAVQSVYVEGGFVWVGTVEGWMYRFPAHHRFWQAPDAAIAGTRA